VYGYITSCVFYFNALIIARPNKPIAAKTEAILAGPLSHFFPWMSTYPPEEARNVVPMSLQLKQSFPLASFLSPS